MTAAKTIVFVGPSLPCRPQGDLPNVAIVKPIRRGDFTIYGESFDTFVIIDGEFGQSLAVSPKEILGALDRGKRVLGAASMGALRASELDRFGMRGIGWVYERFRSAVVRRDDDVAMTYSPRDFTAWTVPFVNVAYWSEMLLAARTSSSKEVRRIAKVSRSFYFADRTEDALLAALENELGASRVAELLSGFGGSIPDVKRLDARRAIEQISNAPSGRGDTSDGW